MVQDEDRQYKRARQAFRRSGTPGTRPRAARVSAIPIPGYDFEEAPPEASRSPEQPPEVWQP